MNNNSRTPIRGRGGVFVPSSSSANFNLIEQNDDNFDGISLSSIGPAVDDQDIIEYDADREVILNRKQKIKEFLIQKGNS